jgi:acyl carrier protein
LIARRAQIFSGSTSRTFEHSRLKKFRSSQPRVVETVLVTREQIDRFVLEAFADAAAVEVASLRHSTPLLDTRIDSLTLVAIVTRIEAMYGATFDADELAEILRAHSVGDVAVIVARKLHAT